MKNIPRLLISSAALVSSALWASTASAREATDSIVPINQTPTEVAGETPAETKEAPRPSVELQEVVVVGERAWFEGEKAVFIPSKKEKNLANDPASLLKSMHVPTVVIEGSSIKNLRGGEVTVFINGVRADGIDLSTFWPKHALRVEYFEKPTDPKWEGAESVVNFVMQEYAIGGITRIGAHPIIPGGSNFFLSNKLVYKRMTYGVMFDGGYSRNHSNWSRGTDTYRDIYYKGDLYDQIERQYESHSWSRSDKATATINARYRNGSTVITHTASFSWNRNPGSGTSYSELWTPALFTTPSARSESSSRSISPRVNGMYRFKLDDKTTMSAIWNYSYSRNHNNSYYRQSDLDPILNSSAENVHTASVNMFAGRNFTDHFTMTASVASNISWYDTHYGGSTNTVSRQWRGGTNVNLPFTWRFGQQMFINVTPSLNINYWRVHGSEQHTEVTPTAQAMFFYTPSRKLNMNFSLWYFSTTPGASKSSDVLLRQDELNWVEGSTTLKSSDFWRPSIHVTWMPYSWLRISPSCFINYQSNQMVSTYRQAPQDMGGLIRTYTNASSMYTYGADLSVMAQFLNNNLTLQIQPEWRLYHPTGEYAGHCGWLRLRGFVEYTMGNFRAELSYGGAQKYMTDPMTTAKSHQQVSLYLTYGQGDIYVSAWYSESFSGDARSWNWMNTPYFSSVSENFSPGRSGGISVSYTFGYGKKIDRALDIDAPSGGDSSVLY